MTARANQSSLAFYFWRFDAGDSEAAARRQQIVNDVVVPIFADPRIRTDASCVYARKYTVQQPEDSMTPSLEACNEVRLYIATSSTTRARMTQSVERHVPEGCQVSGPLYYPAKNRACFPDYEWYRRGLTDVAGVALDLHNSPLMGTHRQFVRDVYAKGGLRAFTRSALHDYLLEHSPRYARGNEPGAFWRDILRWGAEANLFPPGHLLANLMLANLMLVV